MKVKYLSQGDELNHVNRILHTHTHTHTKAYAEPHTKERLCRGTRIGAGTSCRLKREQISLEKRK